VAEVRGTQLQNCPIAKLQNPGIPQPAPNFALSQFAKKSYSDFAQRFSVDN
jgi:hypothetical protein